MSISFLFKIIHTHTRNLRSGAKAARMTSAPRIAIIMPETRLIVTSTRNRNFFRKMLMSVESTYHHAPPPNNTPKTTNNSAKAEASSPNTDIPAKTAMKTTTVIGLEAVRKKRDT